MTQDESDAALDKILTLLRDDKIVLLASFAIDILWELRRIKRISPEQEKAEVRSEEA